MGRILSLQGNPREALPNLREAAKVNPESREAHLFLADAYEQLGMNPDAQRERAQAQRLPPPGQQ
jgi:Tfp pilus assembly protein PilF